jgi:segregation and condensation protein B
LDTPPSVSGVLAGSEAESELEEAVVSHNGAPNAITIEPEGDGAGDQPVDVVSVAEAARMLGVGRARMYQLLEVGALEAVDAEPVQITLSSVQRRLQGVPPVGAQLAPLSAWAILALASGDGAFLKHVAGLLADPDRSRARSRLKERGLLELLPRLRERATGRGFLIGADQLVELLADPRLVLGGSSAARLIGWDLPEGSRPVEAYVPEHRLADVVEHYGLERDEQSPDLLLRSAVEPWAFPPHARLVPALVAALDLAESTHLELAAIGRARLEELARDVETDWRQRPPRRRPVRPIVPSGRVPADDAGPRPGRSSIAEDLWDDRAEADAEQLVGLLFVAAEPLKRSEINETLRISPARLSRACAVLQADPPRGLRLLDTGDQLTLVSGQACTATVERYLNRGAPDALSQAALEVLAIVAYEQPVTRADIRAIRGVDSDGPVETLMARKLIAEDPRFGGRGRPSFLVTTELFLRRFALGSLADLPPRHRPVGNGPAAVSTTLFSSEPADGDNQTAEWTDANGH